MKKLCILIAGIILTTAIIQPVEAKWFWQKKKKTQPVKEEKVEKVIKYTVESARQTAFKDVKTELPTSEYKSHITDNLLRTNLSYIKRTDTIAIDTNNTPRNIYPSYVGNLFVSYGVRYHKAPEKVWFYSSAGKLLRFEIDNNTGPNIFPRTSLTYNNKGSLSSVTFYVSTTDQYNFDGKGNLVVHWVGETGYNASGQPIRVKRSL